MKMPGSLAFPGVFEFRERRMNMRPALVERLFQLFMTIPEQNILRVRERCGPRGAS